MPRPVREYTITLALLAATLAVTFYPMLFDGRTILPSDLIDTMTLPFSHYYGPQHAYNSFITDGYLQFYPLKYFNKLAYEHGNFAFWNPYILNGYPQYLEGMWTYNFLLFLPLSIAFPLLLLLPLLVAGVGMYALLREYNVRSGIARIFATAYMMNTLFMAHLLVHFIPASFSFAPFVILFLHKYNRKEEFQYLAASAIAMALGFLAGNLQTIGFLIFLVVCYWICAWLLLPRRSSAILVKPLAIVLGFAIGLSAVMLLPMLELFRETILHGAFFSTSLLNSYTFLQRIESIALTLTFFIPQLAGSIRGVTLQQAVGVYVQDFEGAIGFVPLLIAVWASFALWNRKVEIRPFVILMIAGLGLPIATPLFHFLYHRFFVVFIFGACVTGAMALEVILSSEEWDGILRKWIRGFALGIFLAIIVIGVFSLVRIFNFPGVEAYARVHLLPRLQHSVFSEGNPAWVASRFVETLDYWRILRPEIIFGIATSLIALAILYWRKRLGSGWTVITIWIITTVQLFYFARLWFPFNNPAQYPIYPATGETKLLQSLNHNSRTYFYREVDSTKQFVFMNNENVVYGIPEATGYVSMMPRCLYIYTAIVHWRDSGLVTPHFLGKFNIGTVVRVKPMPIDSLELLRAGPLWTYKNLYVSPRAFLAHRIITCRNDSDVLRCLNDSQKQWPAAYFTESQAALPFANSTAESDSVSISEALDNTIAISSFTRDSSYLILTDTYYPGWKASVDGHSTPILRCNYSMRAVLLPPGRHNLTMYFSPRSFWIGTWISILSLLLLLGGFAARLVKKSGGTND